MNADPEPTARERHGAPDSGSLREGVCLALLLHIGVQALYAFAFIRTLGIDLRSAIALLMMWGGVTQAPYMVPAIVDALLLRERPRTARGIALVAMVAMGISVWCFAFARGA